MKALKNYRRLRLLGSLLFCGFTVLVTAARADETIATVLEKRIAEFHSNALKQSTIALAVVDPASGKLIFGHNENQLMIPASTLKLVTSYAAFRLLGSDYKFATDIYFDRLPGGANSSVGNIYVRGHGDPTLTEEILMEIAQAIAQGGVSEITDLAIDDSLFINPRGPLGPNPYQAGPSSVSLNYNAFRVRVTPAAQGHAAVVALTPGTPYTLESAVMTVSGSQVDVSILEPQPGKIKVQGKIGVEAPQYSDYRPVSNPAQYYGSVFRYFLEQAGIRVTGEVKNVRVLPAGKLFQTFYSRELGFILRDLNRYSNNFIAGQLLYAIGEDDGGFFRMDLAIKRIGEVLQGLGISPGSYSIVDGSGLDRQDRLTTLQLTRVLSAAYQNLSIFPEYVSSLSRFGHSGTLKDRDALLRGNLATSSPKEESKNGDAVWAKSGTLDGVSALAGYFLSKDNKRLCFSMIINEAPGIDAARGVEDELLTLMLRSNAE